MPSACARVISTPELLEAILAQLEPLELLRAQRLSRSIHTAITSSPRLQQLLFFRPAPAKNSKIWAFNPMLRQPFLPWFVLPGNRWSRPDYATIELLDWIRDEKKGQAFLRVNASWRKMLLIQPPPKSLNCRVYCHGQIGDSVKNVTVPFDNSVRTEGVTMGIIYDLTESFLENRPVSSFGLSVSDTETGPQITLHLLYTVQCCHRSTSHAYTLRSNGAEMNFKDLLPQLKAITPANKRGRLSMTWETHLTTEKGGVDHNEFEEWKRERTPLSRLVSSPG